MSHKRAREIVQMQDKLRLWREKPQIFVREVFHVEPDPWQDEVLAAFPHKPRIAMKASKGPGKSSCLAWLGWNYLITRPHPKGAATSNSKDNLRDNLWSEFSKWKGRMDPALASKFEVTQSKIFLKEHPETWFISARTWAKTANEEELGAVLAGLHAEYTIFLIDEAGAVPRAIMPAAEGALAAGQEGHLVMAGNTNTLESPLYDADTKFSALWHGVTINGDPDNPLRSSRVDIQWAREQLQMYGRDNDFVRVNVLGEWPKASLNSLIGPEEVDEAMKRSYPEREVMDFPRILACDTAGYGDDANVITKRQGPLILPQREFRQISGRQVAGYIASEWRDWDADGCLVDDTGGYGGALVEGLVELNRNPFRVHFSGEPYDRRHFNKRMEIYWLFVEWLRRGGALPPDSQKIKAALCASSFTYKGR